MGSRRWQRGSFLRRNRSGTRRGKLCRAYTGKEEKTMRHTTHITIEHVVVSSNQLYEKVIDALEARLGPAENWEEILRPLLLSKASWELVTQTIEEHIGASGLTIFSKVEHSPLLSLAGKTSRATQYTVGNPLFATQMTIYMPEAALYAPLKLVVYEDEEGRTFGVTLKAMLLKGAASAQFSSSSTLLVGLERRWGDFVPGASIDPIDTVDEEPHSPGMSRLPHLYRPTKAS
jgi:uncharacterized protein (DUF302 family)